MEKQLSKILEQAKNIKPSQEFKERSLRLIFAEPQTQTGFITSIKSVLVENFKFSLALGLTTLMLFGIFGGIKYWQNKPSQVAELNNKELLKEVKNLDFQIQLKEAKYFDESAQDIAIILDEIEKSDQKESVDELLNKLF